MARYSHSVGVRLAATVTTAGLLAMLTGSCLITTDPEFKVPEPGAPVLLPDTISPDPRDVIVIGATDAERLFEAQVQSEDAGAPLEVRLLFNYGQADGELTEESPVQPLTVYARTKVASEEHLAEIATPTWRVFMER